MSNTKKMSCEVAKDSAVVYAPNGTKCQEAFDYLSDDTGRDRWNLAEFYYVPNSDCLKFVFDRF